MTTAATYSPPASHEESLAPYRAVCRSAVLSLVLALISLPLVAMAVVSCLFRFGDAVQVGLVGGALALPAALLGWSGWRTVRRYPDEYTGGGLARFGFIAGLALLLVGFSAATFTYATEVPDGYERIGFWDLALDPDRPDLWYSPKAEQLEGKRIFIKGYMHPGVATRGKVNNFILVKDLGTCCFGGQPQPTHMIAVYIPNAVDRPSYSTQTMKLAGTFHLVKTPSSGLGVEGVLYHLQADQVR
ncbi:MAG TPA: DUF3299 domain-containing protein [Pirellulaceae bacterium]|nr:DUF3299 domain-containing protein [Pirellulaceae bacterium]